MAAEKKHGSTTIEHWSGNAYVIVGGKPDIPADKARLCPQCGHDAWEQSRWCWNCKFDFDRAAIARFHPVKVLTVALWLALLGWLCTAALHLN